MNTYIASVVSTGRAHGRRAEEHRKQQLESDQNQDSSQKLRRNNGFVKVLVCKSLSGKQRRGKQWKQGKRRTVSGVWLATVLIS